MHPVNVWLVGDADDPCFAPAVEWLSERVSLHRFASLAAATEMHSSSSGAPDCLVVCASRPGQIDPGQVAAFSRREPLARFVQLLGSWCEGEARSGHPVAGVRRVYWHQWRSQLPLALGLKGADSADVHLPRTASEGDWLDATLQLRPSDQQCVVAVVTHRAATFDALADALKAGGFEPIWQRPTVPPPTIAAAAMLCDGWPCEDESPVTTNPRKPAKILLLDFPRLEDQRRAQAAGCFAIVSRPYLLAELWATLDAAIAAAGIPTTLPTALTGASDHSAETHG